MTPVLWFLLGFVVSPITIFLAAAIYGHRHPGRATHDDIASATAVMLSEFARINPPNFLQWNGMVMGKGGGNVHRGDKLYILMQRANGKTPADVCLELRECVAQLESQLAHDGKET